MTGAALAPGVVAVVIESHDDENVGAVVNVEYAYDEEMPADEERRSGWWVVTGRAPMKAAPDIDSPAQWSAVGAQFLVHSDSLLVLKAGENPGDPMRWQEAPAPAPAKKRASRRRLEH